MFDAIVWTLAGIPVGYVITEIINHSYKLMYNTNVSKFSKYSMMTIIIFCSFLKGCTGNDLMTNILINYY